jgi:pyruvate dehydrogenase E2 component (dihydrolipoamide acetyltransferase)
MPTEILMPALSPTMTEGNLAKWLKSEGDEVSAGDVIAEIETDKATMEVEAVDEGILGKILVPDGTEGVQVNQPIALLLEEGEDKTALEGYEAKGGPAPKPAEEKEPAAAAGQDKKSAPKETPAKAAAPKQQEKAAPAPAAPQTQTGERVFASPLARRMAQQAGIDITALKGSGPHGRVVKADIDAAMEKGVGRTAPAAGAPATAPAMAAGVQARKFADSLGMAYELQPHSNMRKTIARRLTEAKQTVPHFYLTVDCVIDDLLTARKRINEENELKISVNDFVIKAAAIALKRVPAANASWDEDGILLYEHADISVAVATPSGLITPIVKAAENKGLESISTEMKDLAGRAREGKLKPEEYQGGTFSVSNLGMYGIKDFGAIINPPQGCILAVGAGERRAVVKDGALAVATVMSCTLSVDHRVVDGAVGAEFLAAFKKLIENPLSMLL